MEQVEFFAEMTDQAVSVNLCDKADKSGKNEVLAQNPLLNGLLNGSLSKITKPNPVMADPTKPYTLYFDNNLMKELWVGC